MIEAYQQQRTSMVELLRARGISDERVLGAMSKIPRHIFVPEPLAARAYDDYALPIGHDQSISQPYMVARMTELLELDPDSRVLEIGAGSGYHTAVLARLARQVFSIERIAELARRAQLNLKRIGCHNAAIKCFDGTIGWSQYAPYDAILVAAAGPTIPAPLVAQLGIGGRLVMPIGDAKSQRLVRLTKTESSIAREEFDQCVFVKLIGRYGWPEQKQEG